VLFQRRNPDRIGMSRADPVEPWLNGQNGPLRHGEDG
jgi:hypothetical protein